MRASNRTALALALAAACVAADSLSAHRRDELLQAARIGVEPGRVDLELDLTPGMTIAEAFIAGIDRDRNGTLSVDEQREYVDLVLDGIHLELDGLPLRMQAGAFVFPPIDELRRGEAAIQLRSSASLPDVAVGGHRLDFGNAHQPDRSVYLANALVPASDRIAVVAQHRDSEQHNLRIDFVVRPSTSSTYLWLFGAVVAAALLGALLMPARVVRA